MIKQIIEFLQKNIWRTDIETLPKLQAFFVHHFRIFLLAITRFNKNDCLPRASALTYYTLLSIVPVLALAFGIAKGFGLEEALNRQLENYLGAHEEILEKVVSFSYSLLEETSGGIIAGIGFIFLLWSVIRVMTYIELSFNVVLACIYFRTHGHAQCQGQAEAGCYCRDNFRYNVSTHAMGIHCLTNGGC
ncbi:MAG: YihY/virulence factor BrkB family protein [Desulfovibrionales bacterium]|nr:YihY/virulence factor BrkB family protein [Desulfovibrionales bacterium]